MNCQEFHTNHTKTFPWEVPMAVRAGMLNHYRSCEHCRNLIDNMEVPKTEPDFTQELRFLLTDFVHMEDMTNPEFLKLVENPK